jgi:hypothetical protein
MNPKPKLTMWMSETDTNAKKKPWYDIKPIIHPELKPEEAIALKYTIKTIEYYMKKGDYQFVLNRASEKGLYDYVDEILQMQEILDMDTNIRIDKALYLAAKNGHEDIVLLLLYTDLNNENTMFPNTELLTREDLLYAIKKSAERYPDIAIMIQRYYLEEVYMDKNDRASFEYEKWINSV